MGVKKYKGKNITESYYERLDLVTNICNTKLTGFEKFPFHLGHETYNGEAQCDSCVHILSSFHETLGKRTPENISMFSVPFLLCPDEIDKTCDECLVFNLRPFNYFLKNPLNTFIRIAFQVPSPIKIYINFFLL